MIKPKTQKKTTPTSGKTGKAVNKTKVLTVQDLEEAVSEFNLKRTSNKYGMIRLSKNGFSVCQARNAKYGIRFYLGYDGLTPATRIVDEHDLENAVDLIRALLVSRVVENNGTVKFKHEGVETKSCKELIKRIMENRVKE